MNNRIKTIIFGLAYPLFLFYYKLIRKQFPKVLNTKQTLEKLIDERKSLSRFGDGEFRLIAGRSIGFQNNDKLLAKELNRVLTSPGSNCLIGIPDVFDSLKRFKLDAKFFWTFTVVKNWHFWNLSIPKRRFVDSLCSRFYMDLKDKSQSEEILNLWEKLWSNRDVVIIEGEHSKMGVGNDLFRSVKSLKRIICPSKNAFYSYNKILEEAKKIDKNVLILIALGPTASILAYDLSNAGFQAIDTGHLDLEYNWLINKSRDKEAVAGRMINELNNISFEEIRNEEYESQIITTIVHNS